MRIIKKRLPPDSFDIYSAMGIDIGRCMEMEHMIEGIFEDVLTKRGEYLMSEIITRTLNGVPNTTQEAVACITMIIFREKQLSNKVNLLEKGSKVRH